MIEKATLLARQIQEIRQIKIEFMGMHKTIFAQLDRLEDTEKTLSDQLSEMADKVPFHKGVTEIPFGKDKSFKFVRKSKPFMAFSTIIAPYLTALVDLGLVSAPTVNKVADAVKKGLLPPEAMKHIPSEDARVYTQSVYIPKK